MKHIAAIIFLLVPFVAAAQNYQEMSEAGMQNMMQKAQEMQVCMEKVDQAELEALGQRADALDAELKTLCAQGKRDEAQKRALAFAREMEGNSSLKQMKECSKIMQGALPQSELSLMDKDRDYSSQHVCD